MTQNKNDSILKDLLSAPLPASPDPQRIVLEILRRDRRRMRLLAALSILFWIVGITAMLLIVIGLNLPAIFRRVAAPSSLSYQMLEPMHSNQILPWAGGAIGVILLAVFFTALLISSSRQATLNRINMSLRLISEELKQIRQRGKSRGGGPPSHERQEEWENTLEAPMKKLISFLVVVAVLTIGLGVATVIGQSSYRAGADDATRLWRDGPKLAPFQAIRWRGQVPEVRVSDNWYGLISLNDISTDQLISFAQSVDQHDWRKRIQEDLPAVLILMGHPAGSTVKLTLKDLASGSTTTLERVPMTEENRTAIYQARVAVEDTAAKLWSDGPRVSAFQGVRWNSQTPQVNVNGKWYELVSFNDLSADQLISFSQQADPQDWKKRFEEDLPAVLILAGHEPGPAVNLKLKDLTTGQKQTMQNVPMTANNRRALMNAKLSANHSTGSVTQPVTDNGQIP
jgi:hypothetical protein